MLQEVNNKMKGCMINQPIMEHKISILRNKNTSPKIFREVVSEISTILCYEAMNNEKLEIKEIETPLMKTQVKQLNEANYVFIPILRAGLGMLEGAYKIISNAKVGQIGIFREGENLEPIPYFVNLPNDISEKQIIILEPVLATGGTLLKALEILSKTINEEKIKILCITASKEGIEIIEEKYPKVQIICGSMDTMNDNGRIIPGLGDAGDRIFGTIDL